MNIIFIKFDWFDYTKHVPEALLEENMRRAG
jgi:hypothetical protein